MTFKEQLWDFLKSNFRWLLIGGIALFLYSKGCFHAPTAQAPIIVRDTVYIKHEYTSPVYTPPPITIIAPKPTIINNPQYKPDTSSMQALRAQFDALVKKHTEQVAYNDRLKIDSLGYVDVQDTVSENRLTTRRYSYSIKERIITNTITIPEKVRNQVFVGLGLNTELSNDLIDQINASVLLKNKKDNILALTVFYGWQTRSPGIGFSYYQKISLKDGVQVR